MTAQKNIPNKDEQYDAKLKAALGTKNPFKVPDGYFEVLPERMIDACKEEEKKHSYLLPMIPQSIRFAAAAAILILAVLGAAIIFSHDKENDQEMYTEFTVQEAYQFNINHLAQMEAEYLLSYLDLDEPANIFNIDLEDTDITEGEIINYLLSENHIEYHIINDF